MFQRILTLQTLIAGAVFVVVIAAVGWAAWRNRASRRADLPFQRSHNTALEASYAVLLAAVAAFLAWMSISANDHVASADQPAGGSAVGQPGARAAVKVDVTAFQWCWRFDYPQAPLSVTGTCANRASDPVMVVPAGQPVQLSLRSRDVIHAFWIPGLAVKKDVMPDHVNTLTLTFDRPGIWLGRCSEFCGTHHATMDFYVRAVSPQQYRQWLAHGGTNT
jgi:cytochrome c oxidase subunit 2